MRIPVLRFLALWVTLVAVASGTLPTVVTAGPPLDLADLTIKYLSDGPRLGTGYSVSDPRGTWTILGGTLGRDDRMTLDVEIRPPAPSVPLDAGPAILFGMISLAGDAGGDVGVNVHVRRVVVQVLPPCDPTDCVHRIAVTLPTHLLVRMAREAEARYWVSIEVSLSLVRTFAQGTWVQHLALYDEQREFGENGTIAQPASFTSSLAGGGATPVDLVRAREPRSRASLDLVERLRTGTDDPSRLPVTVPLLVDIVASGCTPGYSIVTATGDTLLDRRALGASGPVRLETPGGTEWTVVVPSLWWGSSDANLTVGPIAVGGPTVISGRVAGDGEDGLCPPGASLTWRGASAEEIAEFPGIGRCIVPGGGTAIWRPGTIGRCLL